MGSPKAGVETPLFEIVKSASYIIPKTTELMAWDMTATGWRLVLSPKIPAVFMKHVGGFVDSLLGQASEDRPDILPADELPRRVGNMSSGTIYFVLDELRRQKTDKDFAV